MASLKRKAPTFLAAKHGHTKKNAPGIIVGPTGKVRKDTTEESPVDELASSSQSSDSSSLSQDELEESDLSSISQDEAQRSDSDDSLVQEDGDEPVADADEGQDRVPASTKESRAAQRELLKQRKLSKPHGHNIAEIKGLWEKLRVKRDVRPEERQRLIDEIWKLSKGNINDLVVKHDASRVIQTIFKYSDDAKRQMIAKELRGVYLNLARSSYGKYLLVKFLHYGSKETRKAVLEELHGNYRKLMRHKEGAYVIEDAYREYASEAQRRMIVREFYGSEFSIFKDAGSETQNLKELLKKLPEKRNVIMTSLIRLIKNAVEKGSIGFTLVHAVMLEYVQNMDSSEKEEFIDLIGEQSAEMVHTDEGSQVICICLALANAKERKIMIKSLKTHSVKLALDDYGNNVLTTIFAVVDDTVLVSKAFLSDLSKKMVELLNDKYGRRPFMFLLCGLSGRYFSPTQKAMLNTYIEMKSGTSKKDDVVRREELLTAFSPAMISAVELGCNVLCTSNLGFQSVVEVILFARGDKKNAMDAVAKSFEGDVSNKAHGIHQSFAPRALRSLIQEGHWNNATKSVEAANAPLGFGIILLNVILPNAIEWACSEGSFVIVSLLEKLDKQESSPLRSLLIKNRKNIEASSGSNKGAKLILQLLS